MNSRKILLIIFLISLISLIFFFMFRNNNDLSIGIGDDEELIPERDDNSVAYLIKLETSLGDISFETYQEDAPKTVENFIKLAESGFYDGVIFHRVIPGFMIQGGDPDGTGAGGPGYTFADELNPETKSYQEGYKKGVVAMANAGPDTNGSQFFIMVEDYPLPNDYTIFGKVYQGQDIADLISNLERDNNDRPLDPPIINKIIIEEIVTN